VGQSIWAKARSNAAALYILAGIITWPVVTAVIYWGDRLATSPPGLAQGEEGIGFWAAGGFALVVSLLIMIAGWLQSGHKS